MTLSIIIVNWNTRALLQACLSSIFRHRPGFAFEVVIVDNASRDGSPDMVRREFPGARLLENTANLGFAAASNRGAEITAGRYLLFLNSDTLIHDGTLVGAVSYMERHPGTGVIGCRTLNTDGSLPGIGPAIPLAGADCSPCFRLEPRDKNFTFAPLPAPQRFRLYPGVLPRHRQECF